jgi:nucleotide-binding universal stress UspA family protein
MKTILAPVDFSESSKNAAKYAAQLALSIAAELTLFHVLQVPAAKSQTPTAKLVFEEIQASALERLNDLKKSLSPWAPDKTNVLLETRPGTVVSRISDFCRKKGPFIVVMGISRNSGSQNIPESISLDAVNHTLYPLIIIPENVRFQPIQKIGLALDKSFMPPFPFEYLKKLQHSFNAKIDVLYVSSEKKKVPDSERIKYLKDELEDIKPDFHFISTNDLEEGMSKLLEETKVDILLLIPKFHSFFEFHKSQSRKLILNCPVAVMTIHE